MADKPTPVSPASIGYFFDDDDYSKPPKGFNYKPRPRPSEVTPQRPSKPLGKFPTKVETTVRQQTLAAKPIKAAEPKPDPKPEPKPKPQPKPRAKRQPRQQPKQVTSYRDSFVRRGSYWYRKVDGVERLATLGELEAARLA